MYSTFNTLMITIKYQFIFLYQACRVPPTANEAMCLECYDSLLRFNIYLVYFVYQFCLYLPLHNEVITHN